MDPATSQTCEEEQYLNLAREIITKGIERSDRTGAGTKSLFGTQMRFSLLDRTMPLLTTKKVFWKGVVEELLWFIKGDTNADHLSEKGVKIWEANTSREFLDKREETQDYAEGDAGPIYGFQWRHFGAKYVDMDTDYAGQGFDQLQDCINKLKINPFDRRIIMSAWNPSDLKQMVLPPCHMFCQFYVTPNTSNNKDDGKEERTANRLSCLMYQRSGDVGLGVPFNIASYSLLTHIIAEICDMEAYEFIHVIGDTHVYLNHIEALTEQIKRVPYPFPTLEIVKKENIDDYTSKDFKLIDYKYRPSIKMQMAV